MQPIRRNFYRRCQHESPHRQPRVGQNQPRRLNDTVVEEQQVEINRPRPPADLATAPSAASIRCNSLSNESGASEVSSTAAAFR